MRPELYRLVIFIKRLSRTCIYDNTYRPNNNQTEQFSIISIPKKTHKLSKELSLFAQCLAYLTHNLFSEALEPKSNIKANKYHVQKNRFYDNNKSLFLLTTPQKRNEIINKYND